MEYSRMMAFNHEQRPSTKALLLPRPVIFVGFPPPYIMEPPPPPPMHPRNSSSFFLSQPKHSNGNNRPTLQEPGSMGQPPQEQSLGPVVIREVWASNLDSEFELISKIIAKYPFISMDTEFPGVIFRPRTQNHRNLRPTDNYRLLKANVDALNLIQVGLAFSDRHGNLPDLGTNGENRFIWQFNFRDFNVARDLHSPDSVALLHRQGIDFARNAAAGVSSSRFAELAAASGLLFNDAVTWVTFHGAYDLGYLVKVLTRRVLPTRLEEFLRVVNVLFGNKIYDVKHMIRFCNGLYGGLERVAQTLKVDRVAGKCHQAGSDSLLTWHAFQKIRDTYFLEDEHDKHANVLFGLELFFPVNQKH